MAKKKENLAFKTEVLLHSLQSAAQDILRLIFLAALQGKLTEEQKLKIRYQAQHILEKIRD